MHVLVCMIIKYPHYSCNLPIFCSWTDQHCLEFGNARVKPGVGHREGCDGDQVLPGHPGQEDLFHGVHPAEHGVEEENSPVH